MKAACAVPDLTFTVTDADTIVEELINPDSGMSAVEVIPGQGHNKPARYFLSTRLTHRMLVNNIRRTVTDAERDQVVAEFAQRLSSSGPFREGKFVPADPSRPPAEVLTTAGLDTGHTTRIAVLDPGQFSLRNGSEEETVHALMVAMGLGSGAEQFPVQWASSCVFAVVNTQRRSNARGMAVEYLARKKALEAPEIQADADLKATGTKELATASEQLERAIKRAYQHVAYLAQPDPDGERHLQQMTFDDEHSTSLDGTLVWKALAERDKVFDREAFSAKALLHNLRESDYGRTLSDLRAAFYAAPRLPLLYDGDRDLQQAIYDAVITGSLQITDGVGDPVAVTAPEQVNLASAGLRLTRPLDPNGTAPETGGVSPVETGASQEPGAGTVGPGASGGASHPEPVKEQQVSFAFTRSLLGDGTEADRLADLFKVLYQALDERQISYGQGTLQLVVSVDVAELVASKIAALGIDPTIRPA